MRWIPFIAFFLYVYIEISIFIQVAHVLGVLLTLILVIFTSFIGMSLVRNQGFKNLMLMQQKMQAGESPAVEMIKSVQLTNQQRIVIFGGGYPVVLNNQVIGAVGVSGGTVEQDMLLANVALEKFSQL